MTDVSPAKSHPSPGLELLRDFLTLGVELRFWVATSVTGLSLFAHRVAGPGDAASTASALTSSAVVFFATLSLYNLDGSLDAPDWNQTSARRRRLHWALTIASAGFLLFFLARLGREALVLTMCGALLSSVYALPLGRSQGLRLKCLPYLKAPFVGSAVAIAVVWVPTWATGRSVSVLFLVVLTTALALFCTANAILFDIPDLEQDRRSGVPTFVVRGGVARGKRVARTLCISALVLAPFLLVFPGAHEQAIAGLFGCSLLGVALLVATARIHHQTPKTTIAWWVDGALFLPLLGETLFATAF